MVVQTSPGASPARLNDTGLEISSPTWQFWSNPFSEPEGRHSLAAFSEPEGATQPSPDRKVGVREEYDGEPRRRRHKQGRKAATPLSSYAQNHIHLVFSTLIF